jgi:ABC-type phosphate transport system auxiliary subunit
VPGATNIVSNAPPCEKAAADFTIPQTTTMNRRRLLTALLSTTLLAAAPAPNAAQLAAVVKAREQRTTLLRDELKAQDARIEARVDAIVNALQSIGDSKDSRTKVARMKEQTIDALKRNLDYFQRKRAALQEELRRPTLQLTEEQKRQGIGVFDARMEKRVAQILALQKSLPGHKDYDRYEATGTVGGRVSGRDWYGTTYGVNEDFRQNQRLTAVSNAQRKEVDAGLRKSIDRLDQQNRALKAGGAPAAEIAKNEALLAERRKQLAGALTPADVATREVGQKEAMELDKTLRKAIDELRAEFTTLFARYHALLPELSALNAARAALAAAPR